MKKIHSATSGISSPGSIKNYVRKENINPVIASNAAASEAYFSNPDSSKNLTNDLTVMIRDYKSENFKFSQKVQEL